MFYFLFHSIPWMTGKEQSKKLCITLFLGTICYLLTWAFIFNKKDDHFIHRVIYYSLVLVVILDLAMLIYSYKEMKNRKLTSFERLQEAEDELEDIVDPPSQEEQVKRELEKIVQEIAENSAAKIVQNWWIRWRERCGKQVDELTAAK